MQQQPEQQSLFQQKRSVEIVVFCLAMYGSFAARVTGLRIGMGRRELGGWSLLLGPLSIGIALCLAQLWFQSELSGIQAKLRMYGTYWVPTPEEADLMHKMDHRPLLAWSLWFWVALMIQGRYTANARKERRTIHSWHEGSPLLLRFLTRRPFGVRESTIKGIYEPMLLILGGVQTTRVNYPIAAWFILSGVCLLFYQAALAHHNQQWEINQDDAQTASGLEYLPEENTTHTVSTPRVGPESDSPRGLDPATQSWLDSRKDVKHE